MIRREVFEARRNTIESLNTRRHCHIVEGFLRWLQPDVVVEVGAFHGFMSVTIARVLMEMQHGRLIIVDNWHDWRTNEGVVVDNLIKCEIEPEFYEILTGTSADLPPDLEVDMAVIDADHSYAACRKDLDEVLERKAYCIGLHDSAEYEGVRMVVDELRDMSTPKGRPRFNVVEIPFDAGFSVALERFHRGPVGVDMHNTYP